MQWLAETWRKLLMIARRDQLERDLEEEMRDHVARKAADLGDPDAARRALGNPTQLREESREAWVWMWIERLIQDLRYATRVLIKSPGFTVVAVLTIALAIAGSVTVFSFIDALFLRTLRVPNADRLVRIYGTGGNRAMTEANYAEYRHLRARFTTLDSFAGHYSTSPLYVTIDADASELSGAVVSASYFGMLGLKPALGRFFTAAEDLVPDRDAVAVIGYGLWQSRFGGDSAVTQRTLRINGRVFQIVGVAPEGFHGVLMGLSPNQIWIPLMMSRVGYRWCDALTEDCHLFTMLGRLAPGKSTNDVRAEFATLIGQVWTPSRDDPWHAPAVVEPATGIRIEDQPSFQTLARLLAATAGTLLLIACANLGGLLLARGATRAKEIAMRISLGASRARVLRQLLTESVLLSLAGGALGILISQWTNRLLFGFYTRDSEGYRKVYDFSLDPQVLGFAAAVSVAAGILFGLLPALQASRVETAPAIKGTGTGSGGLRSHTRTVLISAQVALSLALLVGAGLLARSASNVEHTSAFDVRNVVALRLRPRLMSYAPEKAQTFLREILLRLSQSPAVKSVTLTSGLGHVWGQGGRITLSLPGDAPADPQRPALTNYQEISPRYFETLRVGILRGREFDDHDVAGAPRVAIVNETLARRLWKDSGALDQMVVFAKIPYRVVGVVQDSTLYSATGAPTPTAFLPFWQNLAQVDARVAIRVHGDPESAMEPVKRIISAVDPDVPVTELMPMIEQVRGKYSDVRLAGAVLLSASVLALLLSALGLYGVIAFVAARRTREVGIRMALGARPAEVIAMFLKQGLALLMVGGVAGLVLALATTRMLKAWLYGISAFDPRAFFAGIAVLGITAVLASWIPARRAARIDPMSALRSD